MYPNLRAEIVRKGIKHADIANYLGITRSSLSAKMTGKRPFTWEEVEKISDMLNVDVSLKVLFKKADA